MDQDRLVPAAGGLTVRAGVALRSGAVLVQFTAELLLNIFGFSFVSKLYIFDTVGSISC